MKHALALLNGDVDPRTMGEFGTIAETTGRDETCFYKHHTYYLMPAHTFANSKKPSAAPNGNRRNHIGFYQRLR